MKYLLALVLLSGLSLSYADEITDNKSCIFAPTFKNKDFYINNAKEVINENISKLPCIVKSVNKIATYKDRSLYIAHYLRGEIKAGYEGIYYPNYNPGIKHIDTYIFEAEAGKIITSSMWEFDSSYYYDVGIETWVTKQGAAPDVVLKPAHNGSASVPWLLIRLHNSGWKFIKTVTI